MAALWESPLEFHKDTGEPFIRLLHPHEGLVLTPPRLSDVAVLTGIMNDPKVYQTLQGPPHPYLQSHAVEWLERISRQSADVLREYREAEIAERNGRLKKLVGACPVRYIREIQEDGTDILLGDIHVDRCGYPDVLDQEAKARLVRENEAREAGDSEIVWCIGGKQPSLLVSIAV